MQSPMPATPESPAPASGNGAIAQAAEAAAAPLVQYLDPEASKRLAALQSLAKDIRRKERERDKQETVCGAKKSELEDEREKLGTINRTLVELHEELATLATGKHSERLQFSEPATKPSGIPNPTSGVSASEDWRSVRLDTLSGIKPGKLKALAEHGTGINTIGDLVDHQAKHGDFWAKDIKGLGKGGADQVADAMERYWAQHPRTEEKTPVDSGADPTTFIDGVEPGTVETVCAIPEVLSIKVGQIKGGAWTYGLAFRIGDDWQLGHTLLEHPSRVHAIARACDAVDDQLKPFRKKTGKTKARVTEIRRALDALDKKLAAEVQAEGVSADVREFWANRQAKEPEAVPVAQAMGQKPKARKSKPRARKG